MKRITIKELAERLGLSPSTVSRALAGDRNIRRETRERVSDWQENWVTVPIRWL